MNYIGSKNKLSSFLLQSITSLAGADLSEKVFCDIFAGTGMVGRLFKSKVKQVISNDFEYYSYVLNRNYIGNHRPIRVGDLLHELNELPGCEGFIYTHYCSGGGHGRNYFSDANGRRIDAIRQRIEEWKQQNRIDENIYFFLLASLLESADKVANTASVYGAFLKHVKQSAARPLSLQAAEFEATSTAHTVYQRDANRLIDEIEGDILYLDPPYNARQYGANYHLLNTIAHYKPFAPQGKTGLPRYQKSAYCNKRQVALHFEQLIRAARFKYIFLSYNNEGLMSEPTVRRIMEKYGNYRLFSTAYQRFKADRDENRNHRARATVELLHALEKDI